MSTKFSSEKGFILTMAGAAIGLGNIWRFPYLVANYGGGLFIALYLFTLIGLGYFLLLSELSLGKTSGDELFDAPQKIATREMSSIPTLWGRLIKYTSLSSAFLMNIIYTIVIGWILFFFIQNFLYLGNVTSTAVTSQTFDFLTSKYELQIFWSFICLMIVAFFICSDSIKWLEKLSTLFIPALMFILVYLILWTLTQKNAINGLMSVFEFDFKAIGFSSAGINLPRFFEALCAIVGQVIYSLSIGMGVAYIYGSYVSKNINIVSSAKYVIALDTLCSVLAAIFVLSLTTAYDIPKDTGINLTFVTLPIAFEQMFAGSFLMFLFYGICFLAALTTFISLYEPLVSHVQKRLVLPRSSAFAITASVNFAFVMIVLLSFTRHNAFGLFSDKLFYLTASVTDLILLISVLMLCLFIGWTSFGSVYQALKQQIDNTMNPFETRYMQTVLRFIAPILLIILIISSLYHL